MVELYFEDSASKIDKLHERAHEAEVDFTAVDQLVHQFKGSSASFGAHAMAGVCVRLREAGHARDGGACRALTEELRGCFALLRARLEQFMQLETRRKQLVGGG
jgi:histidine-containing phosphotransfer protein